MKEIKQFETKYGSDYINGEVANGTYFVKEKGKLKASIDYLNGRKHGFCRHFDDDGFCRSQTVYTMGKETDFYTNKREEGTYAKIKKISREKDMTIFWVGVQFSISFLIGIVSIKLMILLLVICLIQFWAIFSPAFKKEENNDRD